MHLEDCTNYSIKLALFRQGSACCGGMFPGRGVRRHRRRRVLPLEPGGVLWRGTKVDTNVD